MSILSGVGLLPITPGQKGRKVWDWRSEGAEGRFWKEQCPEDYEVPGLIYASLQVDSVSGR